MLSFNYYGNCITSISEFKYSYKYVNQILRKVVTFGENIIPTNDSGMRNAGGQIWMEAS